jgi:TatD DNase family protein
VIDSHAHLGFEAFAEDLNDVLQRARARGVRAFVNVGIDVPSSEAGVALALAQPDVFAAVGLHPTSKVEDLEGSLERIEALALRHPERVVAVGEIGLDYHWKDVAPGEQKLRLAEQIRMALRLRLPIIIHSRDSMEDLFAVLETRGELPGGVFHCFSGGPADARRAMDLGFHLSFAGNVTYPKAALLQECARVVPPEKLLLETDCPYLAPQPRRGKRNEPSFLEHTLEFLAELKGLPATELERSTEETTARLFGLGDVFSRRIK